MRRPSYDARRRSRARGRGMFASPAGPHANAEGLLDIADGSSTRPWMATTSRPTSSTLSPIRILLASRGRLTLSAQKQAATLKSSFTSVEPVTKSSSVSVTKSNANDNHHTNFVLRESFFRIRFVMRIAFTLRLEQAAPTEW